MNILRTIMLSAMLVPASLLSLGQVAGKPGALPPLTTFIKPGAKLQKGMCNIYVQEGRYLMEIPDALNGRDVLAAITIVKGSAQKERGADKRYGFSGDAVFETVFQFKKSDDGKRMTFVQPYFLNAKDSSTPYYKPLADKLLPVMHSFDVKAVSANAVLIDITDLYNADAELFSLKGAKDELGIGEMQKDKSYITGVKTFPGNINFRSIRSYGAGVPAASRQGGLMPGAGSGKKPLDASIWEVGASWILLPENPMPQRFFDKRVGYFTRSIRDLDNYPDNPRFVQLATRWNLKPKPQDLQKYLAGELVVPEKPILFYIDRDLPAYLVPFFIDGVNEWSKVFEQAGFRNAISAKPEPAETDSSYSIEDVRYSYISYKPSQVPNAYGPMVCDPRSGEIISSRVAVFHNIMDLVSRWYFTMCATLDPAARQFPMNKELVGKLLKNVITHEVGHALGLRHNFAGSSCYNTDSIRNPEFVKRNGFGASVMDYMRYNYVVQPEDKMPVELLLPSIGIYDRFAIEWGYRYLPQFNSPRQEADSLSKWVSAKRKDPRLVFGSESELYDPRIQSEDVGHNAAIAGRLGMKNLKLIMQHFDSWMKEMKADDVYYAQQYRSMVGRFHSYIGHVERMIGARYNNQDALPEEGMKPSEAASINDQLDALAFLEEYLIQYPDWLFPPAVLQKAGFSFEEDGMPSFAKGLGKLFFSFAQVRQNYLASGQTNIDPMDFIRRLSDKIFDGIGNGQPVNTFRRVQQRTLLVNLITSAESKANYSNDIALQMSILVDAIQDKIKKGIPVTSDLLTQTHLESLSDLVSIWKTGAVTTIMANK
ncbi:zinc-dependent metalloprotease [Pseudoflavitalea rhizosphaerae]|uniref:zinc-dependent metalloprotease n=1 Tax=Pseudoflavitalea rhizosphaerae TaxID=1884793 RepID=UPI000F8F7D11|nr:zinc-dependent metalloprotease [Pseudoflavitalea rhizosphaerae]